MTPDEIKRLKVLHVACLNDFTFFVRYFFKAQYRRKWKQWEHLLLIAEEMKLVFEGKTKRLIINCAPRYGKTELCVKMAIAYGLALNPAAKFIHVTYSDDLALDNSEAVRDVVMSAEYQQLFPYVKLKPSSKGKKKWYTEAGGGVYATSFGGQITGFGAGRVDQDEDEDLNEFIDDINHASNEWLGDKSKFAGMISIDDANKVDDADSELLRSRVNERWDSTVSNRVNSRNTPIVNGQQRTHENDLSGYQIKKQGKDWKVVCLPSIKEDGTALCPDKHTIDELLELQKQNDIVFQRQHLQNPRPRSGLLFPVDDLQYYDPSEMEETLFNCDFSYMAIDPASGGKDHFAGALGKLIGNKIYITDVVYNSDGTDYNEMAVVNLAIKENIKSVGCEAVLGFAETARRIREALIERGWKNDFRNLHPRTAKHTRILNRASFVRNNFVFRKDHAELPVYGKYFRNIIGYSKIQEPGSKNVEDDGVDVNEMVAQYYERNFPHLFALK